MIGHGLELALRRLVQVGKRYAPLEAAYVESHCLNIGTRDPEFEQSDTPPKSPETALHHTETRKRGVGRGKPHKKCVARHGTGEEPKAE